MFCFPIPSQSDAGKEKFRLTVLPLYPANTFLLQDVKQENWILPVRGFVCNVVDLPGVFFEKTLNLPSAHEVCFFQKALDSNQNIKQLTAPRKIQEAFRLMRRRFISSWLLTICAGIILGATERGPAAEVRQVTLIDCIQEALEHNLSLKIQRLSPELARLSLTEAYANYEPSLTLSIRRQHRATPGGLDEYNRPIPPSQSRNSFLSAGLSGLLPTGLQYSISATMGDSEFTSGFIRRDNASGSVGIQLSQPLLKNFWIDMPRLTIILAKKDLKISELALRKQLIDTITQIELAYLELIAARENVKVQEAALKLAEELYRENKKRVEVGVLPPLDEKQAEAEVAATRAALIAARNQVKIRENALKQLISERFIELQNVEFEPAEPLQAVPHTFSLQDSWNKALTMRPDLLQAKLQLEKQNISLKYYKNQLFPELDIVGSYAQVGQSREMSGAFDGISRGDSPVYSYGIVFRYPLGNTRARSRYRAARLQIEQALLQLKQLEQQIMVEVDNAIAQARSRLEQVEASKAAVEYAQQALDAERKKYENGKSTAFEVLRLQRDLTARRSEYIRAVTDYNAALARLAQAEGSTLERHGITLKVED